MPGLVAELVQLKVDVLVTTSVLGIRAAKEATKTIPIVMVADIDPVATGLVDSLAHPGGNITGVSRLTRDLSGKRLELLKEVVPGIARVGILWDANAPGPAIAFKEYGAAAVALKIALQSLEASGPNPTWRRHSKLRLNGVPTLSSLSRTPCSRATQSGLWSFPYRNGCPRCTRDLDTWRLVA